MELPVTIVNMLLTYEKELQHSCLKKPGSGTDYHNIIMKCSLNVLSVYSVGFNDFEKLTQKTLFSYNFIYDK